VEGQGGVFLSKKFNGDIWRMLQFAYPDIPLNPHRFYTFKDEEIEEIISNIAYNMNILYPSMWYNIAKEDIYNHGGKFLLKFYEDSIYQMLQNFYFEMEWIPWKFQQADDSIWKDRKIQRKFFDWIRDEMEIRCDEDWYDINLEDFGGGYLLTKYYNGSLWRALGNIYDNMQRWKPWKFQKFRWGNMENQREALDWLEQKLLIFDKED
jgi:hypothetical protein